MKVYFRYVFILLFSFGISFYATAQQKDPLRVELTANLNMEDYNFVPCGENGVLVFFESEDKGSEIDTKVWHFAFYNKNFKQMWLADTTVTNGLKFHGFDHDNGNTFLLFLNTGKAKTAINLEILKIDYTKNIFNVTKASIAEGSVPMEFIIQNGKAIIGFNNQEYEPGIAFIDLRSGSVQISKQEIEGMNIMQQLTLDPGSRDIYAIIENYLGKKQNAIFIFHLTEDGTLKQNIQINPAIEDKVLNAARFAQIQGDTLLVVGTYSNDPSKVSENTDETGAESAGYFITKFVGGKELLVNYYNFLEFEEMFRSLSSKTVVDLRGKAQKKKNKGEEYSLDYTLILHDVLQFNGNYVLLSEAYYPEYRTVTNMYYDYYGRPIPQTYTVFDGYRYISGIAASFSSDGELIWDNGIEIQNIVTFKLQSYVGSFVSGGELALFYSNENKLNYKVLGDDMEGEATQSTRIESMYKGDKLMEDLGSRIIHWYGNYFLCYGYQVIKNNRVSGGKRTIFFFNKLAFN